MSSSLPMTNTSITNEETTETKIKFGTIEDPDVTKVSNEVQLYFPARSFHVNIKNLDADTNMGSIDRGFYSKITDTESG